MRSELRKKWKMLNKFCILGVLGRETQVQVKIINALERFGSSAKANLFPPNLFKVFFL
jgi:hypothetical protein